MLESVEKYLSLFGKKKDNDEKILRAIGNVDRKDFVKENLKEYAYVDNSLPSEKGQTISQPSTVARMLQLLRLEKGNNVLEIGAGSGWNACLIGYLVGIEGFVLSLEIVEELCRKAKDRIVWLGINNVVIENSDFKKIPKDQKFDKIIFTAGISNKDYENLIIDYAKDHLNDKGILICPYMIGPLIVLKKLNEKIKKQYTEDEFRFVELILE